MNEARCTEVCHICLEAAAYLKGELGQIGLEQAELKGVNDFVTHVDKTSEQILVSKLSRLIPHAGFITEEKTLNIEGRTYEWIIDPLDGTTNFIHGIPCFSISVALRHEGKTVLGVVHEVNLGESFYTWDHAPAFLNGREIRVSQATNLSESLIATGFPNRDYSRMEAYMALLNDLMFDCHGIRRLGSAAVDLAWVACGRFEAFYEYYLSPWDVAAGALLVLNAGGKVTDFSGGGNYLFGQEILSSNTLIHDELYRRIRKHFDR